jgi:hypothetical protein
MKTTTESSPMETTATTMEASASASTPAAAAVSGSPCYGSERYEADANY